LYFEVEKRGEGFDWTKKGLLKPMAQLVCDLESISKSYRVGPTKKLKCYKAVLSENLSDKNTNVKEGGMKALGVVYKGTPFPFQNTP